MRAYDSRFMAAPDGLALHLRDYPGREDRLPVVCLPGLTRNSADFHELAMALSARGHRVLAFDLRGRGLSARDPDPSHYDIGVELADVAHVLGKLGVAPAALVGTSRGGLIGMAMGAAHPEMLRALVLNDIGPVIETKGLMRLTTYVGKLRQPRNEDDAAELLKILFADQFPKMTNEQWRRQARATFVETADGLVLNYDPALSSTVAAVTADMPSPTLWPVFDALASLPILVLRGELSDLLSVETVKEMQERHPGLVHLEIADQGHAPHLDDQPLIDRIAAFIDEAEIRTP